MEKKILVATDGSPAADRALDYVGMMAAGMIRDLKVTVFYVMSQVPPFMRREGADDPAAFRRLQALENRNRQAARQVLDGAKERLQAHGIGESAIEFKAAPRASDAARDILFEAEHGLYDALVMGRRGLSKAQELFMGSVTNKVVQHAERLPLWIVGGQVTSLKVLAAVDGSEGSLKAVDHMAFMLGGNHDCHITLFHVGASLANYCPLDFDADLGREIEGDLMTSEAECMDDFYARAVRVLEEAGLDRNRISTQTHEGGISVPAAILNELKSGGYGTVVLGRRGESRSFFLGHASDKVLARLGEAAAWIVG